MPTLRENYEKCVEAFRKLEQKQRRSTDTDGFRCVRLFSESIYLFEYYQEEALRYLCLLEQIDQQRPLEQIQNVVISRLRDAVKEQTYEWQQNRRLIRSIQNSESPHPAVDFYENKHTPYFGYSKPYRNYSGWNRREFSSRMCTRPLLNYAEYGEILLD